jgi:hypothetical protein
VGGRKSSAGRKSPPRLRRGFLEREQHADLADLVSADELEDLEWRETRAGRRVRQTLGSSGASGHQQRAVFRLQRAFDLRYGQVAATAAETFARQQARQQTEQQIRAVLGEFLYSTWLARQAGALADRGDRP